ncbi:hypothetical protein PtB15_1B425 [Puccinia triticina]|nr:hypothetical protein PtB15_1B425 [Puccinia triticina]
MEEVNQTQWLRLSSNPNILPCGLNPKPEIAWNLKPDSIALIPLTLGSVWVQAARQMGASRWKDPYKPAQSSTHIDNQQLLLLDFISKEEVSWIQSKWCITCEWPPRSLHVDSLSYSILN